MHIKRFKFGFMALVLIPTSVMAQAVLYVDDDAANGGDGATWSSAYRYVQDAMAQASLSGLATDIRVAGGTYRPDLDESGNVTAGDRGASIQLLDNVQLQGGYAGLADLSNPNHRDLVSYESILSGDINGDDGPSFSNNADNVHRIVIGTGTTATAVLDGFTISGANNNPSAAGPDDKRGGGMHTVAGSPIVRNCLFTGNTAIFGGGAMFNRNSLTTIENCTFIGNATSQGGGAIQNGGSNVRILSCTFAGNTASFGAAIYNDVNLATVTVVQCTFDGNIAWGFGGAISNSNNNLTLIDSVFTGNSGGSGGAIGIRDGLVEITNCAFSGNTATSSEGGAIGFDNGNLAVADNLTMTHCVFAANSAAQGTALAIDSYQQQDPMTANIANCVFWDGGNEIVNNDGSTITVTYSDVQGGNAGTGNIDSDPLFADANGSDGIAGTGDDDLRLSSGSPCSNAGSNGLLPPDTVDLDGDGDTAESLPTDKDGHARILCTLADMGAYEFGIGDYDCNEVVNMNDFANWDACMTGPGAGPYGAGCEAFDFVFDADVDLADFATFATYLAG